MRTAADDPSGLQKSWQTTAQRLRVQIDRTLAVAEAKNGADGYLDPNELEKLAVSALHTFMLERQAASLDRAMQREAGGW